MHHQDEQVHVEQENGPPKLNSHQQEQEQWKLISPGLHRDAESLLVIAQIVGSRKNVLRNMIFLHLMLS